MYKHFLKTIAPTLLGAIKGKSKIGLSLIASKKTKGGILMNTVGLQISNSALRKRRALGRALDEETSRRKTREEVARIMHQRSGRHERISLSDRLGGCSRR